MDNTLVKIKEQCSTELLQYASKVGWSASMAETVCNLVCTMEKICKMEQMEQGGGMNGYSGAGTWMARGNYGGNPMSRGMYSGDGGGMGGYSGGSSYGMDYNGDTSGAHWVRGHYSRDGSRDMLVQQMDERIREATDPAERERLMQAKQALMR